MKKIKTQLGLLFLIFTQVSISQVNITNGISKSQKRQIDSLFIGLNDTTKPGVVMAIIHDKKVVYKKSFGAANITYKTPIGSDTKFQIADMARHFTAFGILLLEKQKKLSLEDDARKYISQLSRYVKPIKIIDLLRNSDGLYDVNALKTVSGRSYDFEISNDQVLGILPNITSSNFSPGTNYQYTDTSIILLTEIIKKVSGSTFSEFMGKEVFEPVGMTNTTFVESDNVVLTNLATPYRNRNDQFVDGDTFDEVFGISNLFSTIDDLVKWELNVMHPNPENKLIFEKLNSLVTLDSKKEYSTSLGKLTYRQQFTHLERGLSSTYHTGQYGGFASSMFRFPDQNYAAIVLSNNGLEYNGYFGVLAAHILLRNEFPEPPSIDIESLDSQPISRGELQKYEGTYWDEEGGFYRTLKVENDTLKYARTNRFVSPLIYLGKDKFQMVLDWDDKIFIHFEKGKKTFRFINGEADPILFQRFILKEKLSQKAQEYVGTFYTKELQIGYDIRLRDGKLVVSNVFTEDVELTPIMDELFHGNQWFMRAIRFQRNSKNEITGFSTAMNDIMGLWFEKMK